MDYKNSLNDKNKMEKELNDIKKQMKNIQQEIAPLLIIDENQEKPELTKKIIEIKSKIEKCLISFLAKNTEIQKDFSDSDITTDEDQDEKNNK